MNKIKFLSSPIRFFILPVGLTLLLISYSLLIGWNLVAFSVFWFLLVPLVSILVHEVLNRKTQVIIETLSGLIIFYGLVILMIYKHYQSDYFRMMILSFLINMIVIAVVLVMKSFIVVKERN
jgi:hypothetical protein